MAPAQQPAPLDPGASTFYRDAMATLDSAGVPFLVGGAYAYARYAGIDRHTKDFDVFVRPRHARRALDALASAGYRTDMTFEHWLGKAFLGDEYVDVIFASGNGAAPVDDAWFDHAVPDQVLGHDVRLCPVEEMIWSKSYIMERERFDGADIVHLVRECGEHLDWDRLIARFGDHALVLYAHLVLFRFVYPGESARVPDAVWRRIADAVTAPPDVDVEGLCRGTLLSRVQYLPDIDRWGYRDARLPPHGVMRPQDVAQWTAAAFEPE